MGRSGTVYNRYQGRRALNAIAQGQAVKLSANDVTVEAAGVGDNVYGFATYDINAGDTGDIQLEDSQATALNSGTALAKGDFVKIDADGKLVKALSGDLAIGYTLGAIIANVLGNIVFSKFVVRDDLLIANGAIAEGQLLKLHADARTVEAVSAVTDTALYVAKEDAADSETVAVYEHGRSVRALAGGTNIAKGSHVKVNAAGALEDAGNTAGDPAVGVALEAIAANSIGVIQFYNHQVD